MRSLVALTAVLVVAGCEVVENPRPPVTTERGAPAARLVNRAWLDTGGQSAPGTVRVFLEDGTLLMTSCTETYRIAQWDVLPDGRIGWSEDGARVEAAIVSGDADSLVLELRLGDENLQQHFTASAGPFTCRESR
jgi:hypothetical protein